MSMATQLLLLFFEVYDIPNSIVGCKERIEPRLPTDIPCQQINFPNFFYFRIDLSLINCICLVYRNKTKGILFITRRTASRGELYLDFLPSPHPGKRVNEKKTWIYCLLIWDFYLGVHTCYASSILPNWKQTGLFSSSFVCFGWK